MFGNPTASFEVLDKLGVGTGQQMGDGFVLRVGRPESEAEGVGETLLVETGDYRMGLDGNLESCWVSIGLRPGRGQGMGTWRVTHL